MGHPELVPSFEYESIHESLRMAVPEFGPTIDEHVEDYDEVLAHVLFGDLTRFVLAAHREGDSALVDRSLRFLDEAFCEGDGGVQDLVAGSFVENVAPWDPSVRDFIRSWPKALRREAHNQGWRD